MVKIRWYLIYQITPQRYKIYSTFANLFAFFYRIGNYFSKNLQIRINCRIFAGVFLCINALLGINAFD